MPTLGIELSCNAEGRINTPIALLAQAKLLTIGKLWLPFVSSSFFCQKYHFLTKIKLTMKPTMLNGKINNKFSLKKKFMLAFKVSIFILAIWTGAGYSHSSTLSFNSCQVWVYATNWLGQSRMLLRENFFWKCILIDQKCANMGNWEMHSLSTFIEEVLWFGILIPRF